MIEAGHFDQLKHWQKTDFNKRLLIKFLFPANYLFIDSLLGNLKNRTNNIFLNMEVSITE